MELDEHGNQRQQLLPMHPDQHAAPHPPATRAECAAIARPCNRYLCRHHLWPQTERSGRPHAGTHNAPTLAIAELTAMGAPSCSLDVAEEGGPVDSDGNRIEGFGHERANKEVAKYVPAPTQSRKGPRKERRAADVDAKGNGHTAKGDMLTAEITKERVRQIVERGLDKQWSAMAFVQAFEDFYSTFAAAGGALEFLWGVVVEPNDEEGISVERIQNDKSRIYVTVALNTSKVIRPQHAERLEKRAEFAAARKAGVSVRKKASPT